MHGAAQALPDQSILTPRDPPAVSALRTAAQVSGTHPDKHARMQIGSASRRPVGVRAAGREEGRLDAPNDRAEEQTIALPVPTTSLKARRTRRSPAYVALPAACECDRTGSCECGAGQSEA